MLFNIFLTNLKLLVHKEPIKYQRKNAAENEFSISEHFWDFNNILFVPAVNVDGVISIDEGFHLHGKWSNKMQRKNLRVTGTGIYCTQGVDLNRNYDMYWDNLNDRETAQPCSEVYRGAKPFSEPETKAIKNMVENVFPTIISVMNFHCYGNLWIRPPNFAQKYDPDPLDELPYAKSLYKDFEENAPVPKGGLVTNAVNAVDYTASGEASDWFLFKKGIFSWSPELGTNEQDTDDFYITQPAQKRSLIKDYKAVQYFIGKHSPDFKFYSEALDQTKQSKPQKNKKNILSSVIIAIKNNGYASYKKARIILDFTDIYLENKILATSLVYSAELIETYSNHKNTIGDDPQNRIIQLIQPTGKIRQKKEIHPMITIDLENLNRMEKTAFVIRGSIQLFRLLTNNQNSTKSKQTQVKYSIQAQNPSNELEYISLQSGTIATLPTEHENDLYKEFFSNNKYNKDERDEESKSTKRELFMAVLLPFLMSIMIFGVAWLLCGKKLQFRNILGEEDPEFVENEMNSIVISDIDENDKIYSL